MGTWIVTGGSSGIGRQLVDDLVRDGESVVVWDLQPPGDSAGCMFERVDMGDAAQIRYAVDRAPMEIDCLVHCAGVVHPTTVESEDLEEAMLHSFRVNAVGFALAVQGLLPRLAVRSGTVVAITSAAMEIIYPVTIAYGASKAALDRVVRQLAVELGHLGIRVNAVAPGSIATEMTRDAWNDPEIASERLRPIPLGFRAEPRAVTEVIRFLASSAAHYVTGETIWIDGGLRLGLFRDSTQGAIQHPVFPAADPSA